jgi:hypothetical protein
LVGLLNFRKHGLPSTVTISLILTLNVEEQNIIPPPQITTLQQVGLSDNAWEILGSDLSLYTNNPDRSFMGFLRDIS